MANVSFIGLGIMGFPMARHLAEAGHKVAVYNRDQSKAARWVEECSGYSVATAREAAEVSDYIFMCLGDDNSLRALFQGENGLLAGVQPGAIVIDHTTASANVARELSALLSEKKASFLDAPVSGGQLGAENGVLTIMVGGKTADYEKVEPIMECYAQRIRLMGEVGAGQITKMVNQICIGGLVQGLSEALHFAESAGLDPAAAMEVVSKGAAQSWQMENRYQTMINRQFEFGFAVDWMRKDFAIVLDEARRNGASLPVTAMVDQLYAEVQAMGGGRWDTSSLMARYKKPGV